MGARDSGTSMGACSGGRQNSRSPSPTPSEVSSGSRETNKRARRSAVDDDLRPVRVKREETDNSVPANKKSRACSKADAVVKTEDMEVSCKAEPREAAGRCTNSENGQDKEEGGGLTWNQQPQHRGVHRTGKSARSPSTCA